MDTKTKAEKICKKCDGTETLLINGNEERCPYCAQKHEFFDERGYPQ